MFSTLSMPALSPMPLIGALASCVESVTGYTARRAHAVVILESREFLVAARQHRPENFKRLNAVRQLPVPSVTQEAAALTSALKKGGTASYLALGLQYDQGPWIVHAEASRVRFEIPPLRR